MTEKKGRFSSIQVSPKSLQVLRRRKKPTESYEQYLRRIGAL